MRTVYYFLLLFGLSTPGLAQTQWTLALDAGPSAHNSLRVSYADDTFQAAWGSSYSIQYLADVTQTSPESYSSYGLSFVNFGFELDGSPLFVGYNYSGLPALAYEISDSGSYTTVDFPMSSWYDGLVCSSIAQSYGKYVAGFTKLDDDYFYGELTTPFAISTDLEQWTNIVFPEGYFVENIISHYGRFMAVGFYSPSQTYHPSEGVIYSSRDGINWSRTHLTSTSKLNDIVFGDREWIAVGNSGSVYTSRDGQFWMKATTTGLNGDLTAVNYGNGYYVVGNSDGNLYTSTNLSDWHPQARYGTVVKDIAVGPDRFMAAVGSRLVQSDFSPAGIADITEQPADVFIVPGDQVVLNVGAIGSSLSYQWYEGYSGDESSPINGAKDATFETPPLNQTGRYWVRASNPVGFEDSFTATLTLLQQPSITSQPEGQMLSLGDYVSSLVSASGNDLSYQWYQGLSGDTSAPVDGETSNRLYFRADSVGVFNYWVQVSNGLGSVESHTVQVTVNAVYPQITSEPRDLNVDADSNQSSRLSVQALGPLLSYQWYEGISGDTSRPIPNRTWDSHYPADDDSGTFYFWVRVSNPAGSVDSRTAVFTVNPMPPVIEVQPLDRWITEGNSAKLSVDIDYRSGTAYQWYLGESGNTSNPVENGQSSTEYLNGLASGTHAFWVRITNPDGSTDSDTAYVFVNPGSYTSWLGMEGLPTDESGTGDPDYSTAGSSFSNLLRYAMGARLNEKLAGTPWFKPGLTTVNDKPRATLQFRMRNNIPDAILIVEESADLSTWTETAQLVSVVSNGDGTETCIYRTSGQISSDRYFLRVRASMVEP